MATGGATEGSVSAAQDSVARAHEILLRHRDLQFEFASFTPPQPPPWLKTLARLLEAITPYVGYVFWGGLALGAALILYSLGRSLIAARWPNRRSAAGPRFTDEAAWRPSATKARTLLEDADRLAAEGRFAEAVHLILFRSIEDIEGRRPDLIRPALTSRDIAALDGVPDRVRRTFAEIAGEVEASFFGGRAVDAQAFSRCRGAYEAFAFAETWA